ncbi:MAG: hypothetical protein AAF557_09925 [Pseudomonadota bacterium]
MRSVLQIGLLGLSVWSAGLSDLEAEQDAEAILPHTAQISDATPQDEKLLRCADLFTSLSLAPMGFGPEALPERINSAIATVQQYGAAELLFGTAIALAFPDGANADMIIKDLGAPYPEILKQFERVENPTVSYFFNIRTEIEAHKDERTVPTIVAEDVAMCRPIVEDVSALASDIKAIFDLHASKMERWAGALRIPISEDLSTKVRMQRCGALVYTSTVNAEQAANASDPRGLIYFAMKAVSQTIDKDSFAEATTSESGPVRNALTEMAEMTHRYAKTQEFADKGPDRLDFQDILQADLEYCRSAIADEILTLGPSNDAWPALRGLPLAPQQ